MQRGRTPLVSDVRLPRAPMPFGGTGPTRMARHEKGPVLTGPDLGKFGSRDRTRTYNLPVNSRTLCRLSYAGLPGTSPRPSGHGVMGAAGIRVAHCPGRRRTANQASA